MGDPTASIGDAPSAVPRPWQLSPPAAGAARIPWRELRGAAEQLESGSHTGRELKPTSPNEVTALESTKQPRQLDGARGPRPCTMRDPSACSGTLLLAPHWLVSHSKCPWAQVWVVPLLLFHPLAGEGSASFSSARWAHPCPCLGHDGRGGWLPG